MATRRRRNGGCRLDGGPEAGRVSGTLQPGARLLSATAAPPGVGQCRPPLACGGRGPPRERGRRFGVPGTTRGITRCQPRRVACGGALLYPPGVAGRGGRPYRTLGLAAGASLDQVRDHYRKLIRLYHPDRVGPLGEWDTAYAVRINRAYRLLRDPGKRPDPVGRTQPAGGPVPKRRNSPGRSPTKAPSRRWPRRAILRWLFKTSRGEPGARPQRRPASRLFQRLGLGLSLAAVTASALFIAHHLLVLYASLAAEGVRPMPPLDIAGPSGLAAPREAGNSCLAPSPSRADCRALSSETRPSRPRSLPPSR